MPLRNLPAWLVATVLGCATGTAGTLVALVHALVLRPIPVARPSELVALGGLAYGPGLEEPVVFWSRTDALAGLTMYRVGDIPFKRAETTEWVRVAEVSGDFFGVFLTAPFIGRPFVRDDESSNQRLAIISESFWRTRFAARKEILGQGMLLGNQGYTIIGIAPRGFDFPAASQVWVPRPVLPTARLALIEGAGTGPSIRQSVGWVGRLRSGVSRDQLRSELLALLTYANQILSRRTGLRYGEIIAIAPLREFLASAFRPTLYALLGGATLLVGVAATNCGLFILALAVRRRPEFALREALGASRAQVACLILQDAVRVGVTAGLIGLVISSLLLSVAAQIVPAYGVDLQHRETTQYLSAGLAFILGLLVSAAGGLACVFASGHESIALSLRWSGAVAQGPRHRVLRRLFTTVQVAAAVAASTGAILTVQTARRIDSLELGERLAGLVVARLGVPREDLVGRDVRQFQDALLTDVRSVAGVRAVAFGSKVIIEAANRTFVSLGHDRGVTMASVIDTTGSYCEVLGLELLAGRGLGRDETSAIVVNQTLARLLAREESPLGAIVTVGAETVEIVGVCEDTHAVDEAKSVAEAYLPFRAVAPAPPGGPLVMHVLVRCAGACGPVEHALYARLASKKSVAVYSVRTGRELVDRASRPGRVRAGLWVGYAFLTLAIALTGVATMVAHGVTERRLEVAVRLTLGSTKWRAASLLFAESVWCAGAGLAVGALMSLWTSMMLHGLVVGLEPLQSWVLAVVCASVLASSFVASLVPALRIASDEPLNLLRVD